MPTNEEMKKALSEAQALRLQKQQYVEGRVRKLYAQGDDMTDPEIARAMGLPIKTVRSMRERLGLPAKTREQRVQLDLSRNASGTRANTAQRKLARLRTRAKPVGP